jgi:hypothetical protein
MCFEGIINDTFWITAPSENQQAKIKARATSQIDRGEPSYLLEANLMAARPSEQRSGQAPENTV